MNYNIFVINPGSTSTKLAFFHDDDKVFETNVFHDSSELSVFPTANDQLDYRKGVILDFLKENDIDLTDVDAFVGRGGASYSTESGIYEINDLLVEDIRANVGGINHPSNLGVQIAVAMRDHYGGRAFMVDSPSSDEFQDLARMTGIAGVYRKSALHVLNLKGTARLHCQRSGVRYEDGNYIVCHIDGGISVSAHRRGKIIDGNNSAQSEGPFTPTRTGTIPVGEVLNLLDRMSIDEVRDATIRTGGFVSHFGTSNSDVVHDLVEQSDPKAVRVWRAMVYNICKEIGAMATVLNGDVDGIILGGGLLRFDDLVEQIREQCEWIAPITIYPGEVEHEAMAAGALRVLRGEEEPKIYTGKPVWDGFDD